MRKINTIKKQILLSLLSVLSITTFSQSFTVNDITYTITDSTNLTVTLTSSANKNSYLTILPTVDYEDKSYLVTSIGNKAFYKQNQLYGYLVIPNSVTTIGASAFEGCSGLEHLIMDNSVITIGDNAFYGCSGFRDSLVIPNSVITIGNNAFHSCSGFSGDLTIPNSVTTIGEFAFFDCKKLTGNLIISSSVMSIKKHAFLGCPLTSIIADTDNPNYSTVDGVLFNKNASEIILFPGGKQGNYTIPQEVTAIREFAFFGCNGLTGNLNISSSLISIGEMALHSCTGLTSITVDKDNPNYSSKDGVLFNKNASIIITYPNGKKGNYSIPSTVTTIGAGAFYLCEGLTGSLILPNSLTTIEHEAFDNCTGLTGNLIIPNSVKTIGSGAFINCSGLTGDLAIPNSVTTIGGLAFFLCKGFTGNLTIPNSVTSIGAMTFWECSGLKGIYSYTVTPIDLSAVFGVFFNVNKSTCTLYVPKGSVNAYKAAAEWQDFLNIVEFDATTDIKNTDENKINIFYNPNTSSLIINGTDKPVYVTIYDINGKLCYSGLTTNNNQLQTGRLPKGIYIVNVTTDGLNFVQKVRIC